jgi:hypothetical protein
MENKINTLEVVMTNQIKDQIASEIKQKWNDVIIRKDMV